MFDRWLYSVRNYIMTFLMILALYTLALEELTYSVMGHISLGKIVRIGQEKTKLGPAKSTKTFTWNYYELHDPSLSERVTGRFPSSDLQVGDSVELQHISGWESWSRPATQSKPWLGWGVLVMTIIITWIAVILGREAQDPFSKGRALRHRG